MLNYLLDLNQLLDLNLDSNPAISPAYSRQPVLRWAAIWVGTGMVLGWYFAVGCPLRGGRGEYKQLGLLFHQKQLRKKNKRM
jgi:hypothetical protein